MTAAINGGDATNTREWDRPTVMTEICRRLIEGESLRTICEAADMPDRATVARWLAQNDDLRKEYTLAREMQAETYADEIVDIADKSYDRDSAAAAKVKFEARKWVASKLLPKKYGEATLLKHADADGEKLSLTVAAEDAGL